VFDFHWTAQAETLNPLTQQTFNRVPASVEQILFAAVHNFLTQDALVSGRCGNFTLAASRAIGNFVPA
jgi:hypothetical protein